MIAINESWRLVGADVVYGADLAWWRRRGGDVPAGPVKVMIDPAGPIDHKPRPEIETPPGVHVARYRAAERLEFGGVLIGTGGGNSGFQALNLAILWGAVRVALVGIDCAPGRDGRLHWHADHGPGLNNPHEGLFADWRRAFGLAGADCSAAGLEVVNAGAGSPLDAFARVDLAAWCDGGAARAA